MTQETHRVFLYPKVEIYNRTITLQTMFYWAHREDGQPQMHLKTNGPLWEMLFFYSKIKLK